MPILFHPKNLAHNVYR